MIRTLDIRNFKSIIQARVELHPLTVIVGANGSGKSNLIEALDFVGSIPRMGVAGAVQAMGGFANLVPKAIAQSKVNSARVGITTSLTLPGPEDYPQDLPELLVQHDIELAPSPSLSARRQCRNVGIPSSNSSGCCVASTRR